MLCWVLSLAVLFLVLGNVTSDDCGRRRALPIQLISHGSQSSLGLWPWHAAVLLRRNLTEEKYICGGTIISTGYILTTAYCIYPPAIKRAVDPSEILIRTGISNLQQPEEYSLQQLEVAEIIIHENFDQLTSEFNIALLKLDGKLNVTDYVKPICLWRDHADEELIVNKVGFLAGWARNEHDEYPDQLQHAVMRITSRTKCRDSDPEYYTQYLFDGRSFCAEFRYGPSTGLADSGSGLYIKVGGRWILRGLLSSGKIDVTTGRLDSSEYILFTDLARLLPWIEQKTGI